MDQNNLPTAGAPPDQGASVASSALSDTPEGVVSTPPAASAVPSPGNTSQGLTGAKNGAGPAFLLIALAFVVVLAAGAGVYYFSMVKDTMPPRQDPTSNSAGNEAPAMPAVSQSAPGVVEDSNTAPRSPDQIDGEVNLLDKTFDDNMEQNFEPEQLDEMVRPAVQ